MKKIIELIKELCKKYKELIMYGIMGVLSTVVNIVSFTIFEKVFGIPALISNVIAWVITVIFAYITNKLYVFESKNYSGWIFGSEQDEDWTQSLFCRGHEPQKEHFFNPVLQNKWHIKHLCELLKIKQEHVYSVIVFSDRCELKSITLYNQAIKVLHLFQLRHGISGFLEKTVLSEADIARLYNLLYPYTQLSEEKKQEHIRNIELDQESREAKRGKICPVCGGELVVRTVKRGERKGQTFYGCSAYPKCHYTEKM